jgi:quercetin dioxygenase-like cupin family protein
MTIFRTLAVLLLLAAGTAGAQEAPPASATPLMTKALADHPGKEVLMLTVDYPPGAVDPVHCHNAHCFI